MTARHRKNNRRRVLGGLALSTALVLAGLAGILFLNAPVSNTARMILIRPGMNTKHIAAMLEREKVVRSALLFRIVSRAEGYDGRFRAGRYTLPAGTGTAGTAAFLARTAPGPIDIRITVPEGLNIREIASLLSRKARVDSAMFVGFSSSRAIAESLGVDNATLEGYLYPDTYFIAEGSRAYDVIRRMTSRFREALPDSLAARAGAMGFSPNEIVTLASLIETEAANDGERPVIASVFHRRLKAGLPLQANPTVQYALGEKRRVYEADLAVDSPYNTYRYRGLPPGPIANPGGKSIIAALYPAKTDFLYFVSNGAGGHVFSKTLAEHNTAVARYKKARNRVSR